MWRDESCLPLEGMGVLNCLPLEGMGVNIVFLESYLPLEGLGVNVGGSYLTLKGK